MPVRQQLAQTHAGSRSLNVPWDQITHTFTVSRRLHPLRNNVWASNARSKNWRGHSPHLAFNGCIMSGSDIQLVTVQTVEVGHPSTWFPTDTASGGVAF